MAGKKTIYLSGPITGVPHYWEPFETAEDLVEGLGYTVITPTRLPQGMDNSQYMRICLAMIDSADAVLFLQGWSKSAGARLELAYVNYVSKPAVFMEYSKDLKYDLKEATKE